MKPKTKESNGRRGEVPRRRQKDEDEKRKEDTYHDTALKGRVDRRRNCKGWVRTNVPAVVVLLDRALPLAIALELLRGDAGSEGLPADVVEVHVVEVHLVVEGLTATMCRQRGICKGAGASVYNRGCMQRKEEQGWLGGEHT